MDRPEHASALILATGHSRGVGQLYPLMRVGPVTAVERCVRLFRDSGVEPIRVVTGSQSSEMESLLRDLKVEQILCPRCVQGAMPAVQAGIRDLDRSKEALFILPADIPLVRTSTIAELIHVFTRSSAVAVRPSFFGQPGHPVCISTELLGAMLTWKTDRNLSSFLATVASRTIDVEVADRFVDMGAGDSSGQAGWEETIADYDIPSLEECKILLVEKCRVNRNVLVHSCKVAQVAYRLCRRLKDRGCPLDEKLILSAALLHDMARGRMDHAAVGARILRGLGFGRVAELVAAHMEAEVEEHGRVTEIDVLRMADRMVLYDRVVTLEQRFRHKLERHAGDDRASEAVIKKYTIAGRLRRKIESTLGANIGPASSGEYEQPYEISAENLLTQAW